jgi:hypothetical protein
VTKIFPPPPEALSTSVPPPAASQLPSPPLLETTVTDAPSPINGTTWVKGSGIPASLSRDAGTLPTITCRPASTWTLRARPSMSQPADAPCWVVGCPAALAKVRRDLRLSGTAESWSGWGCGGFIANLFKALGSIEVIAFAHKMTQTGVRKSVPEMDRTMALINYLRRRGGTYYGRIAVPTDLVKRLDKSEIQQALGKVRDPAEAKRRIIPWVQEKRDWFERLRREEPLTSETIEAEAQDVARNLLGLLTADRMERPPQAIESDYDPRELGLGITFDEYAEAFVEDDFRRVREEAADIVLRLGVSAPEGQCKMGGTMPGAPSGTRGGLSCW